MLGHVAEPGAALALLVLIAQPPDEAARHTIGAAMLLKRRYQRDQALVELRQLARWIFFKLFQIDRQPNHRAISIWTRAAVDTSFKHAHSFLLWDAVRGLYHKLWG